MANFVTVSYGLVTRETSTSGEQPVVTMSDDPWINVSALNPRPVIGDHYDGADFTLDHTALKAAQGAKIAELRDDCAYDIKERGFSVPIDNVSYVYASAPKDQSNIHAAAAAAMAVELMNPTFLFSLWSGIGSHVADAMSWDIRDHTIANLKQIAVNLNNHIVMRREQLKGLIVGDAEQSMVGVLNMTTVAAVEAVVWTNPN